MIAIISNNLNIIALNQFDDMQSRWVHLWIAVIY